MFWSPLLLGLVAVLLPSLTSGQEFRAPITELTAYSNLAACITPVVKSYQAIIYGNNCPQTDLAVAASCMVCYDGASDEYSSALEVVTEYCSLAASAAAPIETERGSEGASASGIMSNAIVSTASVTAVTTATIGQPSSTSSMARLQAFKADDLRVLVMLAIATGSLIVGIQYRPFAYNLSRNSLPSRKGFPNEMNPLKRPSMSKLSPFSLLQTAESKTLRRFFIYPSLIIS
ncbi:hypothetical protein P154DRAFT_533419 [Amniculicola lignicola CBS 123094]|uniref:Uncharacterized protein n=1 Tax=Amniculicola lignicola CBS 123094 TaxID=1392246 RepID=A0A6A5WKH8_9PLEO|nr:hypothetical protein P154DRAFT_533419 [Amniculicola lignicola CBS 123094]